MNRASNVAEVEGSRVSQVRALENSQAIEEQRWSDLVCCLFPDTGERTSVGLCSLLPRECIVGLTKRLCTCAVAHLKSPLLVIETHPGKPSLAASFDVPPDRGLTDLLTSEPEDLRRCVHRTRYSKLWIMPFGREFPDWDYRALEVRYRQIYEMLPRGLRNVLVVLPPIGSAGDIEFPCATLDRIVLAVQPLSVSSRNLRRVVDKLRAGKAALTGAIWVDGSPV
jgi:hypothetical protein